nr:MAG TPA: hypothetical protein [Caudoviricetes sp.]
MRIVHDARTRKHRKTQRNQNIFNKYCILARAFIALNATKYLFCCVRFTVHADTVKMCLHSMDSLHFLDLAPCGTVQGFRLLLDSTGGGGYGRSDSAGVSPTSTRKNKKPPLLLEKSRKKKKEPFLHSENLPKGKKAEIKFIEAPLRHNNKTK